MIRFAVLLLPAITLAGGILILFPTTPFRQNRVVNFTRFSNYILELIFEHNKKTKDKTELVQEVSRVIRASIGNRGKESLVVDFINETDLDTIPDKAVVIDAFFKYAQVKQKKEATEIIEDESLNEEEAKRYIESSLKREYASSNGTELNAILPKMSPLNPQYLSKKQTVFQRISAFIDKFKGVGGEL